MSPLAARRSPFRPRRRRSSCPLLHSHSEPGPRVQHHEPRDDLEPAHQHVRAQDPLSRGGRSGLVTPEESPTVPIAETTSNRESRGPYPAATNGSQDSAATEMYSRMSRRAARNLLLLQRRRRPGNENGVLRQAGPQEEHPEHACRDQQPQHLEPPPVEPRLPPTSIEKTRTSFEPGSSPRTASRKSPRSSARRRRAWARGGAPAAAHAGAQPHGGAHAHRSDHGSDHHGPVCR
jgi:hypothetical protein